MDKQNAHSFRTVASSGDGGRGEKDLGEEQKEVSTQFVMFYLKKYEIGQNVKICEMWVLAV